MEQDEKTIIVEVGGKGVLLTILRQRDQQGALHFVVIKDKTNAFDILNDENRGLVAVVASDGIADFDAAITMSDPSQWVRLDPRLVHPSYLDRVLQEVEKHGGKLEHRRWQGILANQFNDDEAAGSILTGTEEIINQCLFGLTCGTTSYRHIAAGVKLRERPADFVAETMLRRLLDKIHLNLKRRKTNSVSQTNWREDPQQFIGLNNMSKEVRLERAIAALVHDQKDW